MENASKALIIAGAILLAILIIGLGVFIYNQSRNSIGETGMDQLAIKKFNAQFEPYEGYQSGAQVKQVIKAAISNNYTNADDDSLKVKVWSKATGFQLPDANYSFDWIGGDATQWYVGFFRNEKNGIIQYIYVYYNQIDGLINVESLNSLI